MGFLLATTIGGLIVYHQKTLREYERMQPDYRRKLAVEAIVLDRELAQLLAKYRSLVEDSNIAGLPRVDEYEMAIAQAEVEALLRKDPLDEEFAKLEERHGKKKTKTGV